jgi:vacuolar-type H+-ATPase subunit H
MEKTQKNPLQANSALNNPMLKEICDEIRKSTLEPASQEAAQVIQQAKEEASSLIRKAKEEAARIEQETLAKIAKEKASHQESLQRASRDLWNLLQEQFEKQFFSPAMQQLLEGMDRDIKPIANLLEAIIHSLKDKGLDRSLTLELSSTIDKELLARHVSQEIVQIVRSGTTNPTLRGGIIVKSSEGKRGLTLEVSQESLMELLKELISPALRNLLFTQNSQIK